MTLDLREFSRNGSWFAASPTNGSINQMVRVEDGINREVSELTLTRTLQAGDDVIELSNLAVINKDQSLEAGRFQKL